MRDIFGPKVERLGDVSRCARPCTPDNFLFIDLYGPQGVIHLGDRLLQNPKTHFPITRILGIHQNGGSQSLWTQAPAGAKAIAYTIEQQLLHRLQERDGAVRFVIIGNGPVVQYLKFMFANHVHYFPALDMKRIEICQLDDPGEGAYRHAAALHHFHLGSQPYPVPTGLQTWASIFRSETPLSLERCSSFPYLARIVLGHLAESTFSYLARAVLNHLGIAPWHSIDERNALTAVAARGWIEYQTAALAAKLPTGLLSNGFLAIPMNKAGIKACLGVAKQRGETGFLILNEEEVQKTLGTQEKYPHGGVLFGTTSLSTDGMSNGAVDRPVFAKTVDTMLEKSGINWTRTPTRISELEISTTDVTITNVYGEKYKTDLFLAMPGIGAKDIGGIHKGRLPTAVYGVGAHFTAPVIT